MARLSLDDIAERVESLGDLVRRRTLKAKAGGGTTTRMVLQVIGGNAATIGSSLNGIAYAASVTPAAVYNPNVDTVYPAGLGNGYLYIDGIQQANKVLIRHNFYGIRFPVLEGALLRCPDATTTLTYNGTSMTAYLFDWM